MARRDSEGICFLLKECGGSVYQWERLKIGIYALSEGRVDDLGLEKIFNYKFDELCYAGPADTELEEDVASMVMTGYICKKRVKLPGCRTEHEEISLLERGSRVADNFEYGLRIQQIKSVKDVAEKLGNSKIKVGELLNLYCPKWLDQTNKELEYILVT